MTEVVFTVGRATSSNLEELVGAGATMARLTFSFGTSETQLRRANRLRQLAVDACQELKIAGELEGQRLRVGRIESDGIEDDLVVDGGKLYEFRDCAVVDNRNKNSFIPVPDLSTLELAAGDLIVYGDNRCEFEIRSTENNRVIAEAQSSDVIVSTRSIVIANKSLPSFRFDQKNLEQAKFILKNEVFDFLILPTISDFDAVDYARELIRESGRKVGLIAKVGTQIEASTMNKIVEDCDFVILDRSDLAMSLGQHSVPEFVDKLLATFAGQRHKFLVASQVASAASQGISGKMSAPEISDIWRLMNVGIGGFVLAEETAVDGNGIGALEQTSVLVCRFAS